jgi:hypothetical protein
MLSNNGSDNLTVRTNGGFIFAKPLSNGDSYNVTITTQPNNPVQTCSILNGSGTATRQNVQCHTTSFKSSAGSGHLAVEAIHESLCNRRPATASSISMVGTYFGREFRA